MRGPNRTRLVGLCCGTLLSAGCYAGVATSGENVTASASTGGEDSGETEFADEGGTESGGASEDVETCELGQTAKLRMLTRAELDASLRNAFDRDTTTVFSKIPADPVVNGFSNSAALMQMTDVRLEQLLSVALDVSEHVAEEQASSPWCEPQMEDEACARSFIQPVLSDLQRRAPAEDEVVAVLEVFFSDRARGSSVAQSLGAAAAAMILSPGHVYRSEIGEGAALSSPEIADLLAFGLTGSPPDLELREAGTSGALNDPQTRRDQARRLLKTQRGRERLVAFVIDWLHLGGLETLTKADAAFASTTVVAWREELERYVEWALFESDGRLSTLLSSNETFVNAELAALYGVSAPSEGFGPATVPLHPGILARGAVLATHAHPDGSSPVRRGLLVRERLLCFELPPPPPSVDTALPVDPSIPTTRERVERHVSDPSCAGCHQMLDPLGFGFENFDGMGRWRDEENGVVVDASGAFVGTTFDQEFEDFAEMVEALSSSDEVLRCFALQFNMQAMGEPVPFGEACVPESLTDAAEAADGNVVEMVVEWAALESSVRRVR